jgi:hypothetical protein
MGGFGSFLHDIGTLLLGLAAISGGLVAIGKKTAELIKDPGYPGFTRLLHALWESRWTAAALTAVLIGALILVARPLIPAPCGGVNVSITSPTNGMVVNQSQPVLGTINHLCPGQHLWLVLQPGAGGYYPQQDVAVASDAGSWSTATYFGRPSKVDDGLRFALLAVVADNSTDQQFRAYVASGKATGNYPALPGLDDAAVLSQITVIRGNYPGP